MTESPTVQDAATADDTTTDFSAANHNLAFIRERLRVALHGADTALLKQLSDSLFNSLQSHARRRAFLERLEPLQVFVEPRFNKALAAHFGARLDAQADVWSQSHLSLKSFSFAVRQPVFKRTFSSQSLLQAALHNFSEADGAQDSELSQKARLLRQGWPLEAVSAAEFVLFCRQLDLGGQYQKHIDALFKPGGEAEVASVTRKLFTDCDRYGLQVDAHLALMNKRISDAMHTCMMEVCAGKPGITFQALPLRLRCLALEGIKLPGIGVFEFAFTPLGPLAAAQSPWTRLLVHIPNDPQSPLKEYDSWQAFAKDLLHKLADHEYRRFFLNFARKRDQPGLLRHLQGARFIIEDDGMQLRFAPDLSLDSSLRTQDYFNDVFAQRLAQLQDDGRFCAVPTAEQDRAQRRAALEQAVEIGLDILSVGALFMPGLGEVLFGVTVAQLMSQVFTGVEDWAEGDHYEAAHCLSQVAAELAGLAAGALVVSSAAALVRRSALFQRLLQVQVGDRAYLCQPDLQPYACNLHAQELGAADSRGIYRLEGEQFINVQGRYYNLYKDEQTGGLRLRHPSRDKAWAPPMLDNGQGGWWAACERPRQWPGGATLFRRAGPVAEGLSDQEIEALMAIAGRDDAHLRQLFERRRPFDGDLLDACARLRWYRRLQHFNADLATTAEAVDVELVRGLMQAMHEGRAARTFELVEHLAEQTSQRVQLLKANVERDGLLASLLAVLDERERTLLMPTVDAAGRTAQQLGFSMSDWLGSHWQLFFDRCLEGEASTAPGVLRSFFPGLSAPRAAALEASLDAPEFKRLNSDRRLPLRLGELARTGLRDQRLGRALEGFFWPRLANEDNHRLLLHFLALDPRWPWALKLTLDGTADGATQLLRRGDLFVSAGTPAARPKSLLDLALELGGMTAPQGVENLRRQLGLQAAAQRQTSRNVLAIGERKWWTPLQRFDDGRLGYALSGNGIPLGGSGDVSELILELYPDFTERDISAFIQPYATRPRALHTLLATRRSQLLRLRESLARWQAQPGTVRQGAYRQAFAERLEDVWRRRGRSINTAFGQHLGYSLSLSGLHVGELPSLAGVDLSHVVELDLSDMNLATSIDGFIQKLPRLRMLDLSNNHFTELAPGLEQLVALRNLRLRNNGGGLNVTGVMQLQRMSMLETLDLTGTSLAQAPDFSLLVQLHRVQLRYTALREVPAGMRDLPQLRSIDLRDNQITTLPATYLEEPGAFLRSISLDNNPLAAGTFREFLRLQAMESVPAGSGRQGSLSEQFWIAPVALHPRAREHWHLLEQEPGSQALFRLLDQLSTTDQALDYTEALRARVRALLQAAVDHGLGRELMIIAAEPVLSGQSPLRSFVSLENRVLALRALHEGIQSGAPTALLTFSRAWFRQRRLDAFVRQQVQASAALRQAGEDVTLAYRHQLHDRLDLPGTRLVDRLEGLVLDSAQLTRAIEHVRAATDEQFVEFLAQQDYWIMYILQTRQHNLNDLEARFQARLSLERANWAGLPAPQRAELELVQQQRQADAEWQLLRRLTREALGLPGLPSRGSA
ncbi:dermonecrotic toxin domain-containing protein [Pseudomonas rubra]|uniref:RING-type E3 ubiquitin transferase n=1 Tax=Pseudomonas rubra TaxID=2942627 RepID=A0ABT5P8J4_9PSED|nr:DUF6543 domain-containing protein [Pseudomonas rubra]MDD1014622.1 hypothetical protein [Pseudomonas rubra]MDD1040571.1 hypothetical protein [Pseudomonas rubra]MDD1153585.1 hypothetical protein [Pseudomonas rubra]